YTSVNLVKSGYADDSHGEGQEMLLAYTQAPNATPAVVQKIKAVYLGALQTSSNLGSLRANADPYLAYVQDYFWGSNQVKADQGTLFYDVVTLGIAAATSAEAARGAERYVHYIHGTNPLGLVYLSNMGSLGAAKWVTRLFHAWFQKGSNW